MIVDERLSDKDLIELARRKGFPVVEFYLSGVCAYGENGNDRATVTIHPCDRLCSVRRFSSSTEYPHLRKTAPNSRTFYERAERGDLPI